MLEKLVSLLINTEYDNKGTSNAKKDLKNINNETKATNKSVNVLGKSLSFAVLAKAAYSASEKIVELSKKSSDYIETLNVLDVAFNGNTESIRNFTSTIAETLNLDDATLIKATASFKTLANSMQYTNEVGTEFSKMLTQMTLDLSSLYNMDFAKAQSALQYAIQGQGKTLKALTGASVLETTIQTTLDTLGVDAYVEDMTDAEKAMARVITITYQLQNSQGDLARTIESPANQFRVLGEQITQVGRNIGNIFLPAIAAILPYVNAVLIVVNKLLTSLAALFGFNENAWDFFTSGSSSFDDLGASIGGVGDAASKAKKQLSGLREFDKLNVLKTPTSSGGAGGAGGVGGLNPDLLKAFNEIWANYDTNLDNIETKATRIANQILKWIDNLTNFNNIANSITLDDIKNSIKSINESLIYIFNSPKLQNSMKLFRESIYNYISSLKNSIVTIGINLADGLIGGFSQFLNNKKQDIIDDLTRAFDINTIFANSMAQLFNSTSDISIVFTKDNFKGIIESITTLYYEAFSNSYLIARQYGADIINVISETITNNKDKIITAFNGLFGDINNILNPIKDSVSGIFDGFWETYDTSIKPALDNFISYFSELSGYILDIYNKYIQPVLDEVTKQIGQLWNEYIGPIGKDIISIIGEIILIVSELYNQYLKPIVEWVIASVIPILVPIVEFLAKTIINSVKLILIPIQNIIGVLKGVIQFISGIFTGDLNKAIDGIKTIFKTNFETFGKIIETIKDIFKTNFEFVINFFTGFVNSISERIEIIKDKFQGLIDKIKNIVEGIPEFFKDKFNTAFENIKNAFNNLPGFFGELYNKIKDKFGEIGYKIGEVIGNKFKSVINSVLQYAESNLNKPITAINSLITKINGVTGIKLSKLNKISLPRMYENGGLPPVGQMFIANEKGPELVGQIGGQSFVANQNQMMDIIDKKLSNAGGLQNATFVIQVGDEEVARTVLKNLNNMAKSNGKPITIGG